jgi:hypothetical protein
MVLVAVFFSIPCSVERKTGLPLTLYAKFPKGYNKGSKCMKYDTTQVDNRAVIFGHSVKEGLSQLWRVRKKVQCLSRFNVYAIAVWGRLL